MKNITLKIFSTLLLCLTASCVSVLEHNKTLKKLSKLEEEKAQCIANENELQVIMMKYRGSIYDKQLCERRLKSCDQKRLSR